jgi:hypothetical protein
MTKSEWWLARVGILQNRSIGSIIAVWQSAGVMNVAVNMQLAGPMLRLPSKVTIITT